MSDYDIARVREALEAQRGSGAEVAALSRIEAGLAELEANYDACQKYVAESKQKWETYRNKAVDEYKALLDIRDDLFESRQRTVERYNALLEVVETIAATEEGQRLFGGLLGAALIVDGGLEKEIVGQGELGGMHG